MQNDRDTQDSEINNGEKNKQGAPAQSAPDRKNESAKGDTPAATERVKSNAGDGLANEGTNVSYTEER